MNFAQIETTTYCNLSCWFCQNQHYERPPSEVMGMELFCRVLESIKQSYPLEKLSRITFSSYNEPLADPLFEHRVRELSRHQYYLALYTNGTLLSDEIIEFLCSPRTLLDSVVVNLPSVDEHEYQQLVNRKADPSRIVEQVKALAEATAETHEHKVLVNGVMDEDHDERRESVGVAFREHPNIAVSKSRLFDRAGMLSATKIEHAEHDRQATGCYAGKLEQLFIGINNTLLHNHEITGKRCHTQNRNQQSHKNTGLNFEITELH